MRVRASHKEVAPAELLFLTGLVWIVRFKNSKDECITLPSQKNHPSVKCLHVGTAKLMSTAFASGDHLPRLGPAPGAGAASFRAGRQRGRARRITLQCISVTFASTKVELWWPNL